MKKIKKLSWGYCPICEKRTFFYAFEYWMGDYYKCIHCNSIPRQRALVSVVKDKVPDWKKCRIHESSPSGAPYEMFIKACNNYITSYYQPRAKLGSSLKDGRKQSFQII